jgi:hypothetical protein
LLGTGAIIFALIIAGSAQSDEEIAENESIDNETAEPVLFIFVREPANRTFVKNDDGNNTLTLLIVVPYPCISPTGLCKLQDSASREPLSKISLSMTRRPEEGLLYLINAAP